MAQTLKEKNLRGQVIFLSINTGALLSLLEGPDILAEGWTSLWADMERIVGGAALPFLVHIINGGVSADNKARLVFWRWRHPLPGMLFQDPPFGPAAATPDGGGAFGAAAE